MQKQFRAHENHAMLSSNLCQIVPLSCAIMHHLYSIMKKSGNTMDLNDFYKIVNGFVVSHYDFYNYNAIKYFDAPYLNCPSDFFYPLSQSFREPSLTFKSQEVALREHQIFP